MVEESRILAVLHLNLIEIQAHLLRGAINILPILREPVRLALKHRDHVPVVDPETRLTGVALAPPLHALLKRGLVVERRRIVLLRLLPLHVGVLETERLRARVSVEDGDLQRDGTDDGEVHMLELRQHPCLLAEVRLERGDELLLAVLVARDPCALHCVDPKGDHRVVDVLSVAIAVLGISLRTLVALRLVVVGGRAQEEIREATADRCRILSFRPA